jgi:hypothetical protein
MSAKETDNEAVQTTTHYWGYREIDPSEFKYVGGGDDGDGDRGDGDTGGDSGSGAGSADASAAAAAAAQADTDPGLNGTISDVTSPSPSTPSSVEVANISRQEANNICIAECTPNLPTPAGNYGMNFFSCYSNCLNGFGF